jgi:hypothetical protein
MRVTVLVLVVLLVLVLCMQIAFTGRIAERLVDRFGQRPFVRALLGAQNRLALFARAALMIAAAVVVMRQPKTAAVLLALSAAIALVTRSVPMATLTAILAVMAYVGAREVTVTRPS